MTTEVYQGWAPSQFVSLAISYSPCMHHCYEYKLELYAWSHYRDTCRFISTIDFHAFNVN
ncbi:hypothetical protein Lalb_Chr23g0272431 [Lupinus albus]|uniref:Uncharacterized protein n=1 Tax=Lupinus albus TaxID=3870 RepID=A0A6A4N4N2_LUPAL|nr:hypothetical protein Lalb_Chr23g0272431 [Lupinus albus]